MVPRFPHGSRREPGESGTIPVPGVRNRYFRVDGSGNHRSLPSMVRFDPPRSPGSKVIHNGPPSMVNSDPLRPATRTPPRPERRGGSSGGPAGGLQGGPYGPPGDGSGGKGLPPGSSPSWAILEGRGGAPLPGLAGGGGGPPPSGGLAGVDPQDLEPRCRFPGGATAGGGPLPPRSTSRTERGGFVLGEASSRS